MHGRPAAVADALILYSGNRNASSWAMRAWLALREAGIAFREEVIDIRRPQRFANLARFADVICAVDSLEGHAPRTQQERRSLPGRAVDGGVRDGDTFADARALQPLAITQELLHGLLAHTDGRRE